MKTLNEQLREVVIAGKDSIENCGVSGFTLENELTFIENRHLEGYFLIAHLLLSEVKKNENILIGPGWDWMISSHVCRSLGITNINPRDVGISPWLIWGDDNNNPIINIEVDNNSVSIIFHKAVSLFGYENVARMPVNSEINHGLLICNDGVANHFDVEETIDKFGNRILCTKEYVKECDNISVFRLNILQSAVLSRIKRIQQQIQDNGKDTPKLYEKWIWNEDYQLFYDGELNDIPLFDYNSIQEVTKILMSQKEYGAFDELLNIQGLFNSREGYILYNKETVAEYQQKHGIINILGKTIFPWGFLYREDAAWFLRGWVGLSWKQTAEVMKYADANKVREAEMLKHFYLHQGMDNGFNEAELNRVWDSLFKRKNKKALPSKAHCAGRVYLSVFLAKLKNKFPEEFNAIKE